MGHEIPRAGCVQGQAWRKLQCALTIRRESAAWQVGKQSASAVQEVPARPIHVFHDTGAHRAA